METVGQASPNQVTTYDDYPSGRYQRFPPGPPSLWAMKARNAAVNVNAAQQDALNQDPQYAAEYLRTGHPPTFDEAQMGGFVPSAPGSPIGYQVHSLSSATQARIAQQTQTQQLQAAYQQRLAMALQGLKQS